MFYDNFVYDALFNITGIFRNSTHPSEHPMGVYKENISIYSHYVDNNFDLIFIGKPNKCPGRCLRKSPVAINTIH